MKTYSTKLIVSVVAFVVVTGSVFAFALNKSSVSTVTVDTPAPTTTTPPAPVSPVTAPTTPTARIDRESGSESESEDDFSGRSVSTPVIPTPVPTKPTATTPPPVTAPITGKYKDGTYSVLGNYDAPSGLESINVSLTLKNGIVIDATVTGNATNGRSIRYQDAFIGGYKALVIGKSIDSLNLGRVSGSSLTPIGFNDALAQIKVKAKA